MAIRQANVWVRPSPSSPSTSNPSTSAMPSSRLARHSSRLRATSSSTVCTSSAGRILAGIRVMRCTFSTSSRCDGSAPKPPVASLPNALDILPTFGERRLALIVNWSSCSSLAASADLRAQHPMRSQYSTLAHSSGASSPSQSRQVSHVHFFKCHASIRPKMPHPNFGHDACFPLITRHISYRSHAPPPPNQTQPNSTIPAPQEARTPPVPNAYAVHQPPATDPVRAFRALGNGARR